MKSGNNCVYRIAAARADSITLTSSGVSCPGSAANPLETRSAIASVILRQFTNSASRRAGQMQGTSGSSRVLPPRLRSDGVGPIIDLQGLAVKKAAAVMAARGYFVFPLLKMIVESEEK